MKDQEIRAGQIQQIRQDMVQIECAIWDAVDKDAEEKQETKARPYAELPSPYPLPVPFSPFPFPPFCVLPV